MSETAAWRKKAPTAEERDPKVLQGMSHFWRVLKEDGATIALCWNEGAADLILALEEHVRAAEGDAITLQRMALALETQLTISESARQAAEGRAAELEKVADVMRPSREIAAAKAALADEIREWLSGDAFSGSPTAAADYRKARVDWLARYDDALLSSPVPAARDGEAEA